MILCSNNLQYIPPERDMFTYSIGLSWFVNVNHHQVDNVLYRDHNEQPNEACAMGRTDDGHETMSLPRDLSPSTSHSWYRV